MPFDSLPHTPPEKSPLGLRNQLRLVPARRRPYRTLRMLADQVVDENRAAVSAVDAAQYGRALHHFLEGGRLAQFAEQLARAWCGKDSAA